MAASNKELKVVILGAERTGKTALINKYLHSTFTQGQNGTAPTSANITGDNSKSVTVDDQTYTLRFLESSSEAESTVNNNLYHTGDAFVLLYAIDSKDSLNRLKQFHNQLCQLKSKALLSTPIFLVGAKADLDENSNPSQRQVNLEEARHLALSFRCQKLFEISSKNHTDEINDMFTKLVREQSRLEQGYLNSATSGTTPRPPMTPVQSVPEPVVASPQPTITTMAPSTTTGDDSPRRGNVLERLKLGSLRRKSSVQSLVRKKSGSFGESIMSLGSARPSRDNVRSTSYQNGSNGYSNGNGNYHTISGRSSRANGSSPYRLDVDTSAWRETIKWPTEIIPEEDLRMK